tara:strand:- start:6091 stop:6690 length:600 start_codon:yes stop_codon:yes gene_type:complete
MFNYFLFFLIIFHLLKVNKEGYSNIFMKNLNETTYPDNKKFFPTNDLKKLKKRDKEGYSFVPNNYNILSQAIQNYEPNFLSRNIERLEKKLNIYKPKEYFRSPIPDGGAYFNSDYSAQFNYKIIQEDTENKEELLKNEVENDKLMALDPRYSHSHPKNNTIILHTEELNKKILNNRVIRSNTNPEVYKGGGLHPLVVKD